ncbi:MAG: hypothetical protein JWR90_2577 [Marmoricola sp.]|jgi:flagellar protein FliO/FliZ|nr:hypothetical protein [Marmoricola sp.]
MVELAVRLVFSLAVVVGLLLLTVKVGGRRFRPRNGAAVRVIHRQALSRGTAVAVVEVGNRVLVLGTTEHQVNLLTELQSGDLGGAELSLVEAVPEQLRAPAAPAVALDQALPAEAVLSETEERPAAPTRRAGSHAARPLPTGPLAGSVLSVQTWRQALSVATGRAS